MQHDQFIAEIEDIRTQLPPEFEPLFKVGRQGKMRVNT